MKVEQLSDDEMYELKDKLYTDFYYNQETLPQMIATERNVLASATYPTDIPDWLMYNLSTVQSLLKMTFGVTYNFTIWKNLISRLIGGNTIPRLFSLLSFHWVLPSIRRDIFCGGNMNWKYS